MSNKESIERYYDGNNCITSNAYKTGFKKKKKNLIYIDLNFKHQISTHKILRSNF